MSQSNKSNNVFIAGNHKGKLVKTPSKKGKAQPKSKLHCYDCGLPLSLYDISGVKGVGTAYAYDCRKCQSPVRLINTKIVDNAIKGGCGISKCKTKHCVEKAPSRVVQDCAYFVIRKKALPPVPKVAQSPSDSGTSTPTTPVVAKATTKRAKPVKAGTQTKGDATPKAKDGKKRRLAKVPENDDDDFNDPLSKELITLIRRFDAKTGLKGYCATGPIPGEGEIDISWLSPRCNGGVPVHHSYFIWPLVNMHAGLNAYSWGFVYTDYRNLRTVLDINNVQKTLNMLCANGRLETATGKYLARCVTMTDTFAVYQALTAGVANYSWCEIEEETQGRYTMTVSVKNKKISRAVIMNNMGYCSVLDTGGAFSDLTSYMAGKSIDASSARVVASIASRNLTDPHASSLLTTKVAKDNAVFVTSNSKGLSDGWSLRRPWTLFGWFYSKIREHNDRVNDPFVDRISWSPILAAVLFIVTILYHYYYRRQLKKATSGNASLAYSAPGWLLKFFMLGILKSRLSFTRVTWAEFKNLFFKDGPVGNVIIDTECYEYAPTKECDLDASWSIDYSKYRCKPTFGNQLIGVGVVDNVPVMPRTCTHNEHRAVTQRQLRPTVRPQEGFWEERRNEVDQLFRESDRKWCYVTQDKVNLIVNFRGTWQTIDFNLWYRNLSPSARKGVDNAIKHSQPLRRKDLSIKAFMKRENTPIFGAKRAIGTFDPRLISGRSAKYQMETGPATYTITKLVASMWHPNNRIAYSSGLTAEKVGAWFADALSDFSRPIIIENDASRFDSSVSVPALKYEFHVYRRLGMPQSFIRILRHQYKTFGYTPGGVSFSVPGTRKSGDGNTSVGNTVINAAIMYYCFVQLGCKHFRILINGDDSISVIEEQDYDRITKVVEQVWNHAGFEVKVLVFSDPWLAQFCSGRFYPVEGGYRFAPKIGRLVSKLGFSKDKITRTHDTLVRLKGVGLGLQNTVSFLPIAGAYVKRMVDIDVEAAPIREKYKILGDTEARANDLTWAMVSHVYGVARSELVKLDNWFRNVTFPSIIKSATLTHMCDVDISERRIPGVYSALGFAGDWLFAKARLWTTLHDNMLNRLFSLVGGVRDSQWLSIHGSAFINYFFAPLSEEWCRNMYPILTTTLLVCFETLMFSALLYESKIDLKMYDRLVRKFFISRLLGHGALLLINQFSLPLAVLAHALLNWSVA